LMYYNSEKRPHCFPFAEHFFYSVLSGVAGLSPFARALF